MPLAKLIEEVADAVVVAADEEAEAEAAVVAEELAEAEVLNLGRIAAKLHSSMAFVMDVRFMVTSVQTVGVASS